MKLIHLLTTALLAGVIAAAPAQAADSPTYTQPGHSQAEVAEHYTSAQAAGSTYIDGNSASYYEEPASVTAPYAAGTLSPDTLKAMEGMSNFYRWLTGVNDLTVNESNDVLMQAQAFDRNFQFAHIISNSSKPADMDDALWAAGVNCTHNILAWGSTPAGAVTNWMNEGYMDRVGWDTVGHRNTILEPGRRNLIYGYSGSIAIGKMGASGNEFANAFAAFPAPGAMPSDLIKSSRASWTIVLNPNYVSAKNAANVKVRVENLTSGKTYICTTSNDMVQIESWLLNFEQPMDSPTGTYTDSYKVTATGLTDAATGGEATVTYTVNFFDLKTIDSVSVPTGNYLYTGSEIRPEPTVRSGADTLTAGTDYTVSYYNNVEMGTGIVEVRGIGKYCGARRQSFLIEENRKDMSQCDIHLSSTWDVYSGEPIEPAVTVNCFGETLTEGTDYEVSYRNNIEVGTATVTVTGIGEYSGSAEVTFEIDKDMQHITRTISSTSVEIGGTATIRATAMEGAKITFRSTNEEILTVDEDGTVHGVAEGTAEIRMTAAATEHYKSVLVRMPFTVSADVHTMEEVDVTYANGSDNVATVKRRCSVCGKEETASFTTLTRINYVYYWEDVYGYGDIKSEQNEGASYEIQFGAGRPADAEDKTILLTTSDPEIMAIDGMNIEFVGTGDVTLTISAKYNPSVKLIKKFQVSHVLGENKVVKEATCSEKGRKEATCSVCGETVAEEIPVDPENHAGGTYLSGKKDATCGADGYTGDVCCKGCDVVLEAGSVVPATGKHAFDDGKVTAEATCSREGEKTYTCKVCGHSYTEPIPANDRHDWGDVSYEWAEDNSEVTATRICKYNSSHVESETVPATDEVTMEATETEAGERVWTSEAFANDAFNAQTKSEAIPPFGFEVTYEWTETGDDYVVSGSDYEFTIPRLEVTGTAVPYDTEAETIVETVPAEFALTVEPGCIASGSGDWTSEAFANAPFAVQTLSVEVDALGHAYEEAVTEPTCTEQGYTTHTCARCGDSFADSYTEANGHSWNAGKVMRKATCTGTGLRKFTCAECGTTRTEEIPALGHAYEEAVTEPTCTEQGYTTHTCKRCGDSFVDSYTEATGHSWDEGKVTQEPTAEEEGVRTYTCRDCGGIRTESIPRLRSIANASVLGCSLSYGYSGRAYAPKMTVKLGGVTLTEGVDYTIEYADNVDPGTATITVTGIGKYTGTKKKQFEIVDCVSSLVSGRTYQLIPKNNSSTAVCSFGGRMVNNTKVYITDRSGSEAMRFKAIRNADGTWKFINEKCELALAVQQNSSALGAGIVLYDQTTRKAQNWKLVKKSDNSYAIINSVTGYSIAMSDASAVKGTTLSMAETASNGLQRFYMAEADPVDASHDGTYAILASKNKKFGLNVADSSKNDGANVNLYSYSNTGAKRFRAVYSGGGYYRLVNVNSGLVVSVKGNTKANGANVIQSRWAGQSGQRWRFVENADGTVTFRNALGTVLHLNGNKTANGTNVIAKTGAATTAQRWYLR